VGWRGRDSWGGGDRMEREREDWGWWGWWGNTIRPCMHTRKGRGGEDSRRHALRQTSQPSFL
jgi:hypothetical protein